MLRCFSRALEFTQNNNNQHHGILMYSHIISQEPSTRALCFSFESINNYSKDLSRKQKFKNLSVSLARRYQNIECCNFINDQLRPDSNLLFATGEKDQSHKLMEHNETVDLQIRFQRSGLFSWVILKVRIRRLSVSEQDIKLKTEAILRYNSDPVTLLLKIWKREKICQVFGFFYFELTKFLKP